MPQPSSSSKRSPTTKSVGLLRQLFKSNQLDLAPEFQRNNVWPSAAKAYLIDTILEDKPIPIIFIRRELSAQTGQHTYSIIDGQQRLRAIFQFLDNRLRLTQSKGRSYFRKNFRELSLEQQARILDYDLIVEELSGYPDEQVDDMFARINKYNVRLNQQELRHAKAEGAFHEFATRVGDWPVWKDKRIFSPQQIKRMRAVEFAAELAMLMIEGPQDKKARIDVYYNEYYKAEFAEAPEIQQRLRAYLNWIERALPQLGTTRFRKSVDLYSLIGALDYLSDDGQNLGKLDPKKLGRALIAFDKKTKLKEPTGSVGRYVAAASRQTDNLTPRQTRIDVLVEALEDV